MIVTHIIPRGVFANTYQGSYKDTISRVRVFESARVDYRQVLVDGDDPRPVLDALRSEDPTLRVLVEYSHYPRILRAVRRRWPDSFIAVRAHNIEPLQHLDNHGWWPRRGPLWVTYGMGRLFAADIVNKRVADVILPISDWEARVYWARLPGKARVEWLPYCCPDHLVPKSPLPADQRRIVACLPTSQKNRKSWDLATRFINFAEMMKAAGADHDFVVTGDLSGWRLPPSAAVSFAGMVKDLREFLAQVKAVALLSPLGYGFKTTIGDALAAGAQVIAHPRLAHRCPALLVPQLLTVNTVTGFGLEKVIQGLRCRCASNELDLELRQRSHGVLSTFLGGPRGPSATPNPA